MTIGGYVTIYNNISSEVDVHVEMGFYYLNKTLITFGLSVEWLFIVTSILIYGLMFISYPKKNGYLMHLFFMILFYLGTYVFIRTYLVFVMTSMAIIQYIYFKSTFKFLCLIVIAAMFHKSALILIFLPLFDNYFIRYLVDKYLIVLLVFFYRFNFIDYILNLSIIDLFGYKGYVENPHFLKK